MNFAPKILLAALVAGSLFVPSIEQAAAHGTAAVTKTFSGAASWYGQKFNGRRTASGERFNMNDLTAAHRSLPFGTRVRVTNVANGKSVVVRINDRGPFHGNRVIDLSRKAAENVSLLGRGVGRVKLEVLGS
ncbi:septal ring lytic transglycosylase RlpA family protein [Lutibaculum baratangense]|uniref:Endolytic peptidoglycan transglycosylase RlpA n=1 Tax=Lutibaculum baratangense AMV1 TaxID=631454 RepID=V4TFL3_9HYPH|nr:septal ring lytic transglycosylase RlpA family protein [Lutibaculum baratangense]ESR24923.1 Rare lipoprotein A precursor [Lutibaculum baratangense AMV1]